MKFILYHSTNNKSIKQIYKNNKMIPFKNPTFSGTQKTEFLFFNIFFKKSLQHKSFKQIDFIPNGLLFNQDFLLTLLDKTEVYFNPYWSGHIDKDSIRLTSKNFNKQFKNIKKSIMKSNLPYNMTHEILIKGTIEDIKENLFGIIYHKNTKQFKDIPIYKNKISPENYFI